jgi:rubrerythrin
MFVPIGSSFAVPLEHERLPGSGRIASTRSRSQEGGRAAVRNSALQTRVILHVVQECERYASARAQIAASRFPERTPLASKSPFGRVQLRRVVWKLLLGGIMKLNEIIGHCSGIERTIADIYSSFAERWPQQPFGPLWRDLANDELSHGTLLDSAARLPGAEREEAFIDAAKLEAIRAHVVSRLPKRETTLEQALDIAFDLEELELDNIYRRLLALTTDDSRMSSAFRAALGQYRHHEERLLTVIEKHTKDPALLKRAAEARGQLLRHGAEPPES